jgi:hypothetical protein
MMNEHAKNAVYPMKVCWRRPGANLGVVGCETLVPCAVVFIGTIVKLVDMNGFPEIIP